jgi:uncharacterized protein (DUF2164 family)
MTEFPIKHEPALRKELLVQVQNYVQSEFGMECGELAAGFLIDFAGKLLGPAYYNAGLHDALALANQHHESLGVDVLALEQESNPRDR